jgi:hypothetical protein
MLLSLIFYAECHLTELYYAERDFEDYHFTEFRYAECHYTELCYAERHFADCHYTEYRYVERHYADCRGAHKT